MAFDDELREELASDPEFAARYWGLVGEIAHKEGIATVLEERLRRAGITPLDSDPPPSAEPPNA